MASPTARHGHLTQGLLVPTVDACAHGWSGCAATATCFLRLRRRTVTAPRRSRECRTACQRDSTRRRCQARVRSFPMPAGVTNARTGPGLQTRTASPRVVAHLGLRPVQRSRAAGLGSGPGRCEHLARLSTSRRIMRTGRLVASAAALLADSHIAKTVTRCFRYATRPPTTARIANQCPGCRDSGRQSSQATRHSRDRVVRRRSPECLAH
jgi:hypothetical protein